MMEALKIIPLAFLLLCVGGLVAGASALALSGIGDGMKDADKCWNSSWIFTSRGTCGNNTQANESPAASGPDDTNYSDAYYAVYKSQEGNINIASNFGTIGTIAAMVVIISMLGSAMVYFKYFQ